MDEQTYLGGTDAVDFSLVPVGYHFVGNLLKDFTLWGDVETSVNTFLAQNRSEKRMYTIGKVVLRQAGVIIVMNIWEKDE